MHQRPDPDASRAKQAPLPSPPQTLPAPPVSATTPPLTSALGHERAARADTLAARPRCKPSEASAAAPPSADAVAAANVHRGARERR